MSKIIQKKAKILFNVHLKSDYYKLTLNATDIAQVAQPGQFVMLRISDDYQPLLRRPFSIHSVNSQWHKRCIEILYEVIGEGTKILSGRRVGGYLDILGPLGNGFSILNTQYSILVGGGMGVAPLLFLAERIKTKHSKSKIKVLIGAKTKRKLLCKKEFADSTLNVKISTNDGSSGFRGKITDLLKQELSSIKYRESSIYACGPKAMLREISLISKQYNIPAQISLDEYMACGLGVCLGCMIKTQEGYKRICKEGPVFDSTAVII
jgi:dihydroorotate dehydrogenase electron transfer subunit